MKRIFLAALVAFLLAGCVKADQVRLISVDDTTFSSLTSLRIKLTMENLSRKNITLTDSRLEFHNRRGNLFEVILLQPVTLHKKTTETITVPLRVRLGDPGSLLVLASGGLDNMNELTVTGVLNVRAGAMKKKITFRNELVSKIMHNFDGIRATQ